MSEPIFNLINQNLADIKNDLAELRGEIKGSTASNALLLEHHVKNCSWIQFEEAIKKHLTNNQYNANYFMISKKSLLGFIGVISGALVGLFEFLKSVFLK